MTPGDADKAIGGVAPGERPRLTKSQALDIVRQVFGPKGRIWPDGDGWCCGWDGNPGRKVVLRGPDFWLMLFGRYLPPGQKPDASLVPARTADTDPTAA